jgi:hemolysin activation/secretion protein
VRKPWVNGNTILSEEIAKITSSVGGNILSIEQLRKIADELTQLYTNRGYSTSRAYLLDQEVADGVVLFQIAEGSLEEIKIEDNRSVRANEILKVIEQGVSVPLNTSRVEQQVKLLNNDSRFSGVSSSLSPGRSMGKSILTVRVIEPELQNLDIDLANPIYSRSKGGTAR